MATDYFLKIDGIPGDSVEKNHAGEIKVVTWAWGETQSTAGSAGAAGGKVNIQEFHFSSMLDKSGPKLVIACASGTNIKTAVLTGDQAAAPQNEFLKITLSDVTIASYEIGSSNGADARPTQQISLRAGKIEFEYRQQKPDGTLGEITKSGWDVKANKAA